METAAPTCPSFVGKMALVTGASRGIGAAIAQELARCGAQVIGTATTAEGAMQISSALSSWPGCCGEMLDVRDATQVHTLVDRVVAARDGLHILVNNAGITRDGLAMRMKDEDWDAVLQTNLSGVFRLCRAVLRTMTRQRYGRIVNITSVVGASGNAGQANYAAAKAAVAGMSRALAREVASRGITVNCVAPGYIDTDMTAVLTPEQRERLLPSIPMGRMGTPQDIAHAVAYLASEHAAYVTGQELHVNGGMYMA
ncbi:3-oxoacyl-ACP reductase FabG [Candidatus Symbiobacter mobilis]|uniref:3-oxoacyl-[acyl-carrier-protein] reductase n=1 Tax=Candidatus Symbiobacter mobilis CR TaxID=946483 RepID=U5N688_9BURK|nr:3-oxoacyl-ACP reductase FabG [Candidatus Symbiobacter mobilis]AGX86867.1 3-oxoacyl-[acyl-carrier protein] reductase [Candidatus Symbiobacter mobilis CR]